MQLHFPRIRFVYKSAKQCHAFSRRAGTESQHTNAHGFPGVVLKSKIKKSEDQKIREHYNIYSCMHVSSAPVTRAAR